MNDYFSLENFSIRRTLDDDVVILVDLINEAYKYIEKYRNKPRTNIDRLKEKIAEKDYYAISHQDEIVGCFSLKELENSIYFSTFAILQKYRGTGLGAEILGAIEGYAKSKNLEYFEIDRMSVSPWLKKYYEDKGFVKTGEVTKWGQIDLIHMMKKL